MDPFPLLEKKLSPDLIWAEPKVKYRHRDCPGKDDHRGSHTSRDESRNHQQQRGTIADDLPFVA